MPATYDKIQSTTLGSSTATITLSSISSAYTDLVLVLAGLYTTSNNINCKINNDSGSNYSATNIRGNGTSATSGNYSNASFGIGFGENPENTIFQFLNYSNTTTNKTVLVRSNIGSSETRAVVALYRSTSAINRLDLIHDSANGFNTGTMVTLYGIKAA